MIRAGKLRIICHHSSQHLPLEPTATWPHRTPGLGTISTPQHNHKEEQPSQSPAGLVCPHSSPPPPKFDPSRFHGNSGNPQTAVFIPNMLQHGSGRQNPRLLPSFPLGDTQASVSSPFSQSATKKKKKWDHILWKTDSKVTGIVP